LVLTGQAPPATHALDRVSDHASNVLNGSRSGLGI